MLGSKFGVKSGTSMATPHVAGAWALLMRAKPNATVPQVQKALQCSGKRVSRGGIVQPRINVEAALAALQRGRC
ncbi:MAG: S8 family serine peptidase [Hyphomicrobium sp.]|nr:S8 family serine peptidase [Hyphomicrobium sp.]